jgi:hypothetical protein
MEGKYRIKLSYRTGNSFNSEDTTGYLDLTWNDLNIAKENLIRIKEHYEMYQASNSYNPKLNIRNLLEKNKDKEWFVYKRLLYSISANRAIEERHKNKVAKGDWEYRPDTYYAFQCINLKADNGNTMQISAFWCGYFERLYEAEIEAIDPDIKIVFN